MKIRLDNKFNAFPNKTILGYVGETNARTITFTGLSVSGANSYSMIIDYGDGENYEVNIVDGVYTVDASVLKRPGLVNCQVLAKALSEDGTTYTIVKKSNIFALNIGKSIDPGAIPTYEQATSAVEKLIQINPNAKDVLNFTQQIDQNVDDIAKLSGSVEELKGDLVSFQSDIAEIVNPKNWLNLSAVKTGVILYISDGKEHDNENFIVTDKIKIGYGETVSCYKKNDMTLSNFDSICCYDAQGNYLGGKRSVSNYLIEYDNTEYIRISLGLSVYTDRMIYIGSDIPTEASEYFTPYHVVKKDNRYIEKNWTNKKVLILGDSIMSLKHQNVSNALIELLQPSKYVNIAVPGASWCEPQTSVLDGNPTSDNPPSNHIANQIQKIIISKDTDETYSDFDYCIIGAGTNDFAGWFQFEDVAEEQLESYFIGDNGYIEVDTISRKNIIGAMRYGIEKIRYLYPNIVIFISLPIQSAYGYGVQRNPD